MGRIRRLLFNMNDDTRRKLYTATRWTEKVTLQTTQITGKRRKVAQIYGFIIKPQ